MKIVGLKENDPSEKRIPLTPQVAKKLVALGAEIAVEGGIGASCFYSDQSYREAGALIDSDRRHLLASADFVIRINKLPLAEVEALKSGAIHLSLADPFNSGEWIQAFAKQGVSAFSLELIPRSTRAQRMDVLSSQASLAGYAAVMMAADSLHKIFPMMTTPSGTISPAHVFVIGAGVAGLQAIATARRLGANVEAFDTRSSVAEQIRSLGAKSLKIELGQTFETKEGYASTLTEDQLKKQREGIKKACQRADVVITTAQVFGKKAPLIVTRDVLEGMKPGSIVVDLAVESGGNVEGVKLNQETQIGQVRLLGWGNMPSRAALDASQMFANNIFNFIDEFWDKSAKSFKLNLEDEIVRGCLLTHGGKVVHPLFIRGS